MSSYSTVGSTPARLGLQSSVARRVRRPCAVHAGSAVVWLVDRGVCCFVLIRWQLPASSSLSLSEELYEEESDKNVGLSAPVHPFSCLQLRKQTYSADDGSNSYRPLQLS